MFTSLCCGYAVDPKISTLRVAVTQLDVFYCRLFHLLLICTACCIRQIKVSTVLAKGHESEINGCDSTQKQN